MKRKNPLKPSQSSRTKSTSGHFNLIFTDELAPNQNHPLVGIAADRRSVERVRTVAKVLAKLAQKRGGNASTRKEKM
jgi:hypothetical protein